MAWRPGRRRWGRRDRAARRPGRPDLRAVRRQPCRSPWRSGRPGRRREPAVPAAETETTSIVFGGFGWQVPGLLLSVPGLLLVLAVALQLAGGLAWLPVVRRRLGPSRLGPGATRAG